jgi:adenylate cyclase
MSRELGSFLLAGKSRPVVVYELLSLSTDTASPVRERCAIFAGALDAFRRGAWPEATRLWKESLRSHGGEDGPSRFYLRWCESHAAEAPPANWNGVVRMDEK